MRKEFKFKFKELPHLRIKKISREFWVGKNLCISCTGPETFKGTWLRKCSAKQINPGWKCRGDPMLWPSMNAAGRNRNISEAFQKFGRPHFKNWHGHPEEWFFSSTFCRLEGGVWGEGICKRAISNIYLLFHNSVEQHRVNLALRKGFMQDPAEFRSSQQYWRSNSGIKNSCLSKDKDQI